MALSLFNKSRKYVNLEIKDHVIRFVELKQGNIPYVTRCGEYLLPSGIIRDGKIIDFETLKEIVQQCITDWQIAKQQVRFLIPDQAIVLRIILIDKDIKDDEIEGHLFLQLGSSIHLPFEEPVFDTVMLGEKEDKKEVLLFAAAEEVVSEYSLLLEGCKLKPIVGDVSALAIYRLFHRLEQSNPMEHTMILQFDLYSVNFSIFVNDKPNFMRHISIPVEQDLWNYSRNEWQFQEEQSYYMQLLEDIYIEFERVLSFYKYSLNDGKHEVTNVLVTGDHPFLQKIKEDISHRFDKRILSIKVEHIASDPNILVTNAYSLSVGLGLRGGS